MVFSQMLSYTIYIIATRKHLPQEEKKNQRFQREAYNDARNHFLQTFSAAAPSSSSSSSSSTSGTPIIIPSSEMSYSSSCCNSSSSPSSSSSLTATAAALIVCSSSNILGSQKAAYLHCHFYFNVYKEEEKRELNSMWLKHIIQIGEVVAGDEKLYHYTANHMNTKAVPQKKM
jgi:hypothetical protein